MPSNKGVKYVSVYDLAGQKVVTLIDAARLAGAYAVPWDGKDAKGRALASGIYLYRLKVGAQIETRKLALIR